jgi:hypothetical protein
MRIDDFVISPGYRVPEEDAKFTQAPEPLLPNYDEGRIRQYSLDINMMSLFNARERTLDDFHRAWRIGRPEICEAFKDLTEFELLFTYEIL